MIQTGALILVVLAAANLAVAAAYGISLWMDKNKEGGGDGGGKII